VAVRAGRWRMFVRFRGLQFVIACLGLVAFICAGLGQPGALVGAAQVRSPGSAPVILGSSAQYLRADISIRQRRLTRDGLPMPGAAAAAITMRLERRRDAGRWRTSLAMNESGPVMVQRPGGPAAVANPFFIARLEYDDEGGAPRMYDRQGRQVAAITAADIGAFGRRDPFDSNTSGTGWGGAAARAGSVRRDGGGGLVVEGRLRAARRQDLEQRFGRAVGRVRGLDRFVAATGSSSQEVLVTPDTVLPVEVNVLSAGVLQSRTELLYSPYGTDRHVRQLMRTEQSVGDEGRAVTEVELSNIILLDGGGQ